METRIQRSFPVYDLLTIEMWMQHDCRFLETEFGCQSQVNNGPD